MIELIRRQSVIKYPPPDLYSMNFCFHGYSHNTGDQLTPDEQFHFFCLAPTKVKATSNSDIEERKKFTFFFGAENENGEFSQWYIKQFHVNNVRYNCAEQYMMHQKAGKLEVAVPVVSLYARIARHNVSRLLSGCGCCLLLFSSASFQLPHL